MALAGDQLRVQPDPRQHLDEQRADLGNPDILRADAGVAQVIDQPGEEGVTLAVDMGQDRGERG